MSAPAVRRGQRPAIDAILTVMRSTIDHQKWPVPNRRRHADAGITRAAALAQIATLCNMPSLPTRIRTTGTEWPADSGNPMRMRPTRNMSRVKGECAG